MSTKGVSANAVQGFVAQLIKDRKGKEDHPLTVKAFIAEIKATIANNRADPTQWTVGVEKGPIHNSCVVRLSTEKELGTQFNNTVYTPIPWLKFE
jgi:hypothetical protein